MQTHDDHSHRSQFIEELRRRASKAVTQGKSQITGGKVGEPTLAEWRHDGIQVIQRPDDEQGILRISVGGGDDLPVVVNYVTFRGDHAKCIHLLERALLAMKAAP